MVGFLQKEEIENAGLIEEVDLLNLSNANNQSNTKTKKSSSSNFDLLSGFTDPVDTLADLNGSIQNKTYNGNTTNNTNVMFDPFGSSQSGIDVWDALNTSSNTCTAKTTSKMGATSQTNDLFAGLGM